MFNLVLEILPLIFIMNATFILLIHEVVFGSSKKYDYSQLASNINWLENSERKFRKNKNVDP